MGWENVNSGVLAGASAVGQLPPRRVEDELPLRSPFRMRQRERDNRGAAIADEQHMAVGVTAHVDKGVPNQDTHALCIDFLPITIANFPAVWMPPAHVLMVAVRLACALEERIPPQPGCLPANEQQLANECDQGRALPGKVPVDPVERVVLAVSIVVT